jgi:hypothetical protein
MKSPQSVRVLESSRHAVRSERIEWMRVLGLLWLVEVNADSFADRERPLHVFETALLFNKDRKYRNQNLSVQANGSAALATPPR